MVSFSKFKNELWQGKQFFWGLFLVMQIFAFWDAKFISDYLVFNQHRVFEGNEFWRLFSCQFVHWNPAHALSNLAVFALIIGLMNKTVVYRIQLLLITLTLVISMALLVMKHIGLYAGFSATLYGLVVYSILTINGVSGLTKWLVVLVIILKLVLELLDLISTEAMAALIGASIATDMHLIAVAFSILFYFFSERFMVSRNA